MKRTTLLLALLCACTPDTPEEVARAWFDAAQTGDPAKIARWVDPRCVDAPVGKGAPVRILGATVQVSDLELVTTQSKPDEAKVAYSFRGEVHHEGGTHETKVLGKDVKITTGSVDAAIDEMSGTLQMLRIDGQWKVTCTFAGLR